MAEKSTISFSDSAFCSGNRGDFSLCRRHGVMGPEVICGRRDGDGKKSCLMRLFSDHFIGLCHPLSSI